jgi:hypothetical protein
MSIHTKVGAGLVSLCTLFATSALADPVVTQTRIDTSTQGSWMGVYGSCYNVVPQVSPRTCYPEIELGPDFEGTNPEQYLNTENELCDPAVPEFTDAVCISGQATDNFDVRVFVNNPVVDHAYGWGFDEPGSGGDHEVLPGTSQQNACQGQPGHSNDAVYASTFDSDQFAFDPLSGEIKVTQGGDATLAYYFLTEADICRSQKYALYVNNVAVPGGSGEILDFSSGKYVVFDITGIPDGALVRLDTEKIDTDPTCAAAQDEAFNSHLSGIFVDGTQACAPKAPSRTLGYWKNHPTVINNEAGVLSGSLLPLNFCGDNIDEACDAVDYLRSKGGGIGNFKRQGMAALLNCEAFGCPQDIRNLISEGSAACDGGGSFDFGAAGTTLDKFNNANDNVELPFQSPSAQPKYCSSDDEVSIDKDKKGNKGKKKGKKKGKNKGKGKKKGHYK